MQQAGIKWSIMKKNNKPDILKILISSSYPWFQFKKNKLIMI